MDTPLSSSPVLDLDGGLLRLGYTGFRPGQREAIETLLEARRLLLVAPTGGGKSLTYQLPGMLLPGTTLVVSPLVALMQDQVRALAERGVASTFLAAVLSADEMRSRLSGIASGRFKIVYAAPERLMFPGFRALLGRLSVPLVAIDEAHCISEWGHDFRPEYLQIGEFLRELPQARVLACTATATPVVRDEICQRLGLGGDIPQIIRGFARPNLVLRASDVAGARERQAAVDALLHEALGRPGMGKGAAIVYAPTRRGAEEEAARLRLQGWVADAYHAGLAPDQRQRVQERFSNTELEVAVATNAFGMGIDRSDVRAVVHLAPPGSMEAYYQEVGRAGRDGQRSYGLLLAATQDLALRRRLIVQPIDGKMLDPVVIEHKWGLFLELMRWFESPTCRHDGMLRYFGDEQEALGGCGLCDVCCGGDDDSPYDDPETALIVRKALSGVARVHGRFGLTSAAKLLSGQADDRLQNSGLQRVATFGALREFPEAWIIKVLRRCVVAGWVSFSGEQKPLVYLTPAGVTAMRGEVPIRLRLPATAKRPSAALRKVQRLPVEASDLELFAVLRAERLRLAKEAGVPPYVVASDRTLHDLAQVKPRTLGELQMVYGMGETRIERYGQTWLGVLRQQN